MKASCTWKEKVSFDATLGKHTFPIDTKAPIGSDQGASPKELLLAAICGCTGMDVISLLRKGKQTPTAFTVEAAAELTEGGHPHTFKQVDVQYLLNGSLDREIIKDAVHRSMTLYCGVSAMVVKACPIAYKIVLNGEVIATGEAKFS